MLAQARQNILGKTLTANKNTYSDLYSSQTNRLGKYAVRFSEGRLDLNEHFVSSPADTFLIRVTGDSMKNAGIREADLLVVDKSKTVSHNKIVVAELNNSLLVKRYKNENGRVSLSPENGAYDEILINENDNFSIWGVVTSVIRALS